MIRDSAIYNNVAKSQLQELYYLISWKRYLEDQSTWEPVSAIIHF